MYIIED